MLEVSPFLVNHIRSIYSSGLHHKAEMYLKFHYYFDNPKEFLDVLNYTSYPEIRKDLGAKVLSLTFIFDVADEYRNALRDLANRDLQIEGGLDDFSSLRTMLKTRAKNKIAFINKEFSTTYTFEDVESRLYKAF